MSLHPVGSNPVTTVQSLLFIDPYRENSKSITQYGLLITALIETSIILNFLHLYFCKRGTVRSVLPTSTSDISNPQDSNHQDAFHKVENLW